MKRKENAREENVREKVDYYLNKSGEFKRKKENARQMSEEKWGGVEEEYIELLGGREGGKNGI
ncbi:hypothetical protein L484_015673 [Morus notabilis]|uniref:Uncharacterized protein n=1 Tax=Morus notabilis TaxID=981085 RepID=W9S085_9ROSA|nr:hypothetical protein L484_015673 [Morus notabilis]